MKKTTIYYKGNRYIRLVTTLFFLFFLMVQCEIQSDFEYESNNQGGGLNMTAWAYIQQSDSLSLMEEAVTAVGLSGIYSGTEAKTFIIPRNSAFRDYMSNNGYANIAAIPLSTLEDVLKYHIVKAVVNFQDVDLFDADNDNPNAYETESGETMYLSHDGNYRVWVNRGTNKSWMVVTSNLEPTNGVIHVVKDVVYLDE